MDGRFWHASGQLASRGHQALTSVSVPGTSAAVAWEEVSPSRSGIAADVWGF